MSLRVAVCVLCSLAPLSPALSWASDPVRVGLLLCQTGSCAEWGTAAVRGAILASEEINAAGGIAGREIELVVEDSAEDSPSSALSAYRSLRRKKVSLIIGPTWSSAAHAITPIARQDSTVVMISPSVGMRDFNEAGENLFNLWPHDEYNARRLAQFAREQGIASVALFSAQQIWSEMQSSAFKNEFERLGGKVILEVHPTPDTRDLRVEAGKVAHSGAQAVVFTCYSEQLGIAAAQLAALGYQGSKMSVLMYQPAIDVAKGSLNGALYAAYPPPSVDFSDAYRARFSEEPGTSADKAYDAVKLFAFAVAQSPSFDVREIREVIARTAHYRGASGEITFSAKGGVIQTPGIYEVHGSMMGLAFDGSIEARTKMGALSEPVPSN